MFRTSVSFCALVGCTLLASTLTIQSVAQEKTTFPPDALRDPVDSYKSDNTVRAKSTKSETTNKTTTNKTKTNKTKTNKTKTSRSVIVKAAPQTNVSKATESKSTTPGRLVEPKRSTKTILSLTDQEPGKTTGQPVKKQPVKKQTEKKQIEKKQIEKKQVEKKQVEKKQVEKKQVEKKQVEKKQVEKKSKLTPEQEKLKSKLRRTLGYYYFRPSSIDDHSPWGIMHCLIAYGVDTNILVRGRKVNAIGWLCWNGESYGLQLFYTENGQLRTRQGPGVQGHEGQFLAMLAQSRVPADYQIRVNGRKFTVMDLVRHEQRTCEAGTELTFKLIGLVHYLKSDAKWKNQNGEDWSLPKLIQEELKQPVIGSACGGTHRMMGFSYAVRKREKRGEPFTGQWLRAKKYVDAYHKYTFKLQNNNGTFSSNWFEGRGDWGGALRQLETTGHTLEWLVYSLPKAQLDDPRIVKAVNFLNDLMWKHRGTAWKIGPKGHALHALALYDERRFGGQPGKRAKELKTSVVNSGLRRTR